MLVRWFASCTCIVRASIASSYSWRITTRRATYSNTSFTPSPVLAEVKNSLGYRSGGGGGAYPLDGGDPDSGVVAVVVAASACPRKNRLGVMVGAEDMEELEGIRRGSRRGECEGEREAESAVNAGEESADSKVSKRDEEGVW